MKKQIQAKLIPVWMEVATKRGFRWTEGRKIISPKGRELQPYMRTRDARKFCKAQEWICVDTKRSKR